MENEIKKKDKKYLYLDKFNLFRENIDSEMIAIKKKSSLLGLWLVIITVVLITFLCAK